MSRYDSMFDPGAHVQNALASFKQGREMRTGMERDKALSQYAQNPDDPNAVNALARWDAPLAMQLKERQARAAQEAEQRAAQEQEAQSKKQGQTVVMVGRLAKAVKAGQLDYGSALQMAQQNGIDVSNAPPTLDPQWLDSQIAFASVYEKDGGQTISGIARELADAGYEPGTPQFVDAMRAVIQNKYSSVSADASGAQWRNPLQLPGVSSVADDDEWEVVQPGGGVGNGPGGFSG